jgi:hypothetical protein
MLFTAAKSRIAGFSKHGCAALLPLAVQRWTIRTG